MAASKAKVRTLPTFVIDAGNAWIKYLCGDVEGTFVHKLAELTPAQYHSEMERFGQTESLDLIATGGKYYSAGETAESYHVLRREKRSKYTRDYYGILFEIAVARAFIADPSLLESGLRVMASHASDDHQFFKLVIASIIGKHRYECGGKSFAYEVTDVRTYEEPFGGYARLAFIWDDRKGWQTPLRGASVGIVDVGGGTCGVLSVAGNGTVRYATAGNGDQGVNMAVERLASELQSPSGRYKKYFEKVSPIETRVREALASGKYVGFGRELPCEQEVERALNPLLNEVEALYLRKLSAGAGLDVVILTGGGNGLLHERIQKRIDFGDVRMADDVSTIQFANVRGAAIFDAVIEGSV